MVRGRPRRALGDSEASSSPIALPIRSISLFKSATIFSRFNVVASGSPVFCG
jgi:hypothetical protein